MEKLILSKKQRELIERVGVFFEHQGLSPAVARIGGLLLISDRTELTFEEIHTTLNLSKSATSNAINLLLNSHRVEYITKPGDRKRYFRIYIDQAEKIIQERMRGAGSFISLLNEIYDQRTKSTKAFNANLGNLIAFVTFVNTEFSLLYEKWKKSNV